MGYDTSFTGQIKIEPPLNEQEISFLEIFSDTCHKNHEVYPANYCQWVPSKDGEYIKWDGNEKFYEADAWMKFIIDNFLGKEPKSKVDMPFLVGHILNGEIEAQGEEDDDQWAIIVKDCEMSVIQHNDSYNPEDD